MTMDCQIEDLFIHVASKDISASLALFTEGAVFEDPHYPRPRMVGKTQIEKGLRWGFNGMAEFHFDILQTFINENNHTAAVETRCRHKLITGKQLDFRQVFIFELQDNLFKRVSAYEPYGPHGIVGIMLAINHFFMRLSGKA